MSDAAEVRARLRAQIAAIEASPSACKGDAGREAPCPSPEDAQVLRGALHPSCEALDPLQEDDDLCAASGSLARSRGGGVSPAASVEALAADDAERAFRKIERLALAREQASAALRARLVREGFPPEAADAAVGRALACGLVDDARYAEVLVRSRLSQGRGAQGIAAELESLGIDASVVPGWPEEFAVDHESEVARALALLDRKPPRAKNKRDAAYRRLAQKGFGASVASTAARIWSEGKERQ